MTRDIKLVVEAQKSTLIVDDTIEQVFEEGSVSEQAKARADLIRQKLNSGFLRQLIIDLKENQKPISGISDEDFILVSKLVGSVTSEVGRAIIGLSVLQCCIKAICPEQSIRLHKAGSGWERNFSWTEGISMRTIDKSFITPTLREFNLLKLNADGFMMTRSLAENYPYSPVYKAAIRGAKVQWVELVELLETNKISGQKALELIISLLINRSEVFEKIASTCLEQANSFSIKHNNLADYLSVFKRLVHEVEYSARIFEIVLHSAFQSLSELNLIDGYLSPLSQMRSANKKHKNIADIEILYSKQGRLIEQAYDAKFEKANLREEIEELSEKLGSHPDCKVAGFICSSQPVISDEMKNRIADIEELHGLDISLQSFDDWSEELLKNIPKNIRFEFVKLWLNCLTLSLCQRKRDIAPIDEPCEAWVETLTKLLR